MSTSTETTQDRMQINNSAALPAAGDEGAPSINDGHQLRSRHRNTLLMKIIGPVITFVDRPWKVSVV